MPTFVLCPVVTSFLTFARERGGRGWGGWPVDSFGVDRVILAVLEQGDSVGKTKRKASSAKPLADKPLFGATLRAKRLERKISLRKLAEMIGVSSTYLSQVEQDRYAPPAVERVKKIAEIFDEDADEWIGLANRVPDDVDEIVKEHPKEMPELMRAARGLSPEQFARLQQTIKRMKAKGD